MQDDPFLAAVKSSSRQQDDPFLAAVMGSGRQEEESSMLSRLFKGIGQGAKSAMSSLASPGALGPGGVQAAYTTRGGRPITRQQIEQEQQQLQQEIAAAGDLGTAGGVGRFLGEVGATLPIAGATAGAVGPLGQGRILGALGQATTKTGAFGRAAIAGLPKNIVGGVATTALVNPEQVATPEGLAKTAAYSTIGSVFDGVFGPGGVTAFRKLAQQAQANPATALELRNKIDEFMANFSRLSDPEDRLRVMEPQAGPRAPVQLEIPDQFRTNQWEPKRKIVPNSEDVAGYAEELKADLAQRLKITQKIARIMDNINKSGTHSAEQMDTLQKLVNQEDALTLKITQTFSKLGESAENVRNLILAGAPDSPVPQTPLKIRGQQEPNMKDKLDLLDPPRAATFKGKNPPLIGDPTKPGSGTQSPYPYNPDPVSDPLAPVMAPKVTGGGNTFAGLSPEENAIASKIDFGNEAAQAARREQRYLLDTPLKRLDYKGLDFLKPLRIASDKAVDIAQKFLRLNTKLEAAVTDALYIPDGNGGYIRGPESLVPLIRDLGGDGDIMNRFQIYAHARQALSGVKTPFSVTEAQKIVDSYKTEFPEIVRVYETRHIPLVNGILDMVEKYELATPEIVAQMRKSTDYVSLYRSAFQDVQAATGFLKERVNPESQKLVGDYFYSMMSNIRGVIKAGERSQVIRELIKASQANPALKEFIEIVPYKQPEGVEGILSKLDPDTPEILKKAIVEIFSVPQKGNIYSAIVNGKRVSVKLNDELAAALDNMQFRGPKVYTPENAGPLERVLTSPLNALAKTEKTATSIYSVYRDMFGFGLPLDAIEVAMNASSRGLKFNLLTDPVKGFFALYRNDPAVRDLVGSGGGLGSRYANPMAEKVTEGVEDLVRLANNQGIKLRVMNPGRAFMEFAGNLANASRAGLVMANPNVPMSQLATYYNTIIGDPALSGALTQGLARFTGFMNYPTQATRAQLSSLVQNPARLGFTLARAGGLLTAPTLAAWYLTKDDERVQEMSKDPQGRRFMFLPDPQDPEKLLAVPKPQGIYGVLFSTLPQMMMEELRDSGNTELVDQVGKAALQAVTPNVVPLTLNTMIGATTGKTINTSSMSTQDVVPTGRQGLLPSEAGGPGTTNTAKVLADITGVDAGKWDRVLSSFMIGTSFNMFQQLDYSMSGEKGAPVENRFSLIPGIQKTEASRAGRRYVNQFYDEVSDANKVLKTFDIAIRNAEPQKAQLIYEGNKDKYEKALLLSGYLEMMNQYNQQLNMVRYSELYTKEEKLSMMRDLDRKRVELAKQALGVKQMAQ
jgi:hypothetical protein